MSETELAQHFVDHFQHFEVYKEVPMNGGRCDIVAKAGRLIIAIEVKASLSTTVIKQALQHRFSAHYVYVAVPEIKGWNDGYEVCRELGIGVLVYSKAGFYNGYKASRTYVIEKIEPTYRRPKRFPRLHEMMKESVAGAQHNSNSPFRITCIEIADILKRNGGKLALKDFFDKHGPFHYGSTASAKQCIRNLAGTSAIPEFKCEDGFLILNTTNPNE